MIRRTAPDDPRFSCAPTPSARCACRSQRLPRALLDAGRQLALAGPLVAELALAHLRRQRVVVLVGRYLERTGHHAIAAADALPRIVGHRPARLLLQRPDDARRHARRMIAVQAVDLGVDRPGARLRRRGAAREPSAGQAFTTVNASGLGPALRPEYRECRHRIPAPRPRCRWPFCRHTRTAGSRRTRSGRPARP